MQDEKINLGKLIEQYRFLIGGILFGLVVAGFGFLLYQRNQNAAGINDKIGMLENRIVELEKARTRSAGPDKISETANAAPAAPTDQGQVKAAATTAEAPKTQQPTAEPVPASQPQISVEPVSPSIKSESASVAGTININNASANQLDSLPGIGPAYAKAIIEYREARGGFKTIEEIQSVKGIGPKTFEKFKDKITVD